MLMFPTIIDNLTSLCSIQKHFPNDKKSNFKSTNDQLEPTICSAITVKCTPLTYRLVARTCHHRLGFTSGATKIKVFFAFSPPGSNNSITVIFPKLLHATNLLASSDPMCSRVSPKVLHSSNMRTKNSMD